LWAWIATSLLLALLLWLGGWQMRRAHEKEILQDSHVQAGGDRAVVLTSAVAPPADGRVMAVQAEGRYLPDRQLLLDNQSQGGRPGYRVWTPLRLSSGAIVVVDRGWIPLEARVASLAIPDDPRRVTGLWRDLPRPGLRLRTPPAQQPTAYPALVQYPEPADLSSLIGENVLPGVLLLGEDEADGFVRKWNPAVEIPPSRHYGYAAQWFALAATLVVLFVRMNLKKKS
jgi:surfeit locus 1 family protein